MRAGGAEHVYTGRDLVLSGTQSRYGETGKYRNRKRGEEEKSERERRGDINVGKQAHGKLLMKRDKFKTFKLKTSGEHGLSFRL